MTRAIVLSVRGGVADVVRKPDGIALVIKDYDWEERTTPVLSRWPASATIVRGVVQPRLRRRLGMSRAAVERSLAVLREQGLAGVDPRISEFFASYLGAQLDDFLWEARA